jgi:uncharacterized protein with NRDE domain
MCLVALAFRAHPAYRLVLAANRDEFHGRAASPVHWWPDRPQVVGGRDLQAAGTWLAASRTGHFATVTNYRENLKVQTADRSRGALVTEFVSGNDGPLEYSRAIPGDCYAGFSLLTATVDSLAYVSNRGDVARELDPGVYGLSNASLDTPWAKVVASKKRLEALIDDDALSPGALFELLGNRETATGAAAERGVPADVARAISAPFVVMPQYGTRCSTVLLVDDDGAVEMYERRFAPDGRCSGENQVRFRIS